MERPDIDTQLGESQQPQEKKIDWSKVTPAAGDMDAAGIYIAIERLFPDKFPSRITLSNLANKILQLWEQFDSQDYSENPEKQAWALRYAKAVRDKIYLYRTKQRQEKREPHVSSVQTPIAETNESVNDITGPDAQILNEGWDSVMQASLETGRICPALLYLNRLPWQGVCVSTDYKAYMKKSLEFLETSIGKILEIVFPNHIQEGTITDLGVGDGKKIELFITKLLENCAGMKRKITLNAVDASHSILLQALKKIIYSIVDNAADSITYKGDLPSDDASFPTATYLPALREFCAENRDRIPYFDQEPSDIDDNDYINEKLRHNTQNWLLRPLTFKARYFCYMVASVLGLHSFHEDLLKKMNLTLDEADLVFDLIPRRTRFDTLSQPQDPTDQRRTLVTGLGNTPFGNNPIPYSVKLMNKLLKEPEKGENGRLKTNYALCELHLRHYSEDNPEEFEKEKQEILKAYTTQDFEYFVKYPFRLPNLNLTINDASDEANLKQVHQIDGLGEVEVTYGKGDPNEPASAEIGPYYRVEHWFKFKTDVVFKGDGWEVKKKAGEKILLHYSIKFTEDEIQEILKQNGFQVIDHVADSDHKLELVLFRKMINEELKEAGLDDDQGDTSSATIRTPSRRRRSSTNLKALKRI